jgi:hypothetical protein
LIYIATDHNMMAATVRAVGASFEMGAPNRLFTIPVVSGAVDRDEYAVSADGKLPCEQGPWECCCRSRHDRIELA